MKGENEITKRRMDTKRIMSLDIMSALMLLLVVVGHHTFDEAPTWYCALHAYIYSFHMPVFICISGFLIAYTGNKRTNIRTDFKRSFLKITKFFLLTFLVGVLVILLEGIIGGQIGKGLFWIDNLLLLLLYPMSGPAQFLWYIYMLSWMYVVFPLLKRLSNTTLIVLCFVFAFSGLLESSRFLGADLVCRYGFFYLLGIISFRYTYWLKGVHIKYWCVAGIPFVAYTIAFYLGMDVVHHVPLAVSGLLALPFFGFVSLVIASSPNQFKDILLPISRCLLPLYLWQMFFIQGFHLALARLVSLGECYALYVALSSLLTVISIIFAVYCYKNIMNVVRKREGSYL